MTRAPTCSVRRTAQRGGSGLQREIDFQGRVFPHAGAG
jgi:hypothetical protein